MTRHPSRWIIWFALAGAAPVYAQPDVRDHRDRRPAPPADNGPTEAPPPAREENMAPRAGFVWVQGRWDWRGKWDWVPGHWERERAGKHWRAGHWDHRDNRWVYAEGSWETGAAAPPPAAPPPAAPPPGTEPPPAPPPPGEPPREHRHHDWKLDRPTVSSYWPSKGKPGTRVVIHGKNFPADAELLFANQPVRAAKIKPDEIVFEVPAGAASGTIELRTGRRPLIVGEFEVAAAYDPVAEQKRIEDERRKQAEAAWEARQHDLAKDRAAREAALQKRREEREANRERRRAEEEAEIQRKWERAFLADPDTQSELTLHAQRVAELGRMSEMAELSANQKLGVRIQMLQTREDDRHQHRMAALQASFQAKGAQQ